MRKIDGASVASVYTISESAIVPISRLLIGNWNNFADGPVAEFVTASVALGWDNGAQLKAF